MIHRTHILLSTCLAAVIFFAPFLSTGPSCAAELLIIAGAAGKPPIEEAAKAFENKTGVNVNITFGGSGFVLSQMALARKGDIYFPGSSDFMELAKRKGLVLPETERYVVYLAPAINVQKGNPKRIKSLQDMTKQGIRVVIANPDGVCLGVYAVELVEKALSKEEKTAFRRNLVNYTESCEKTATAVSLKAVDAVIGWSVFRYWDPERIETIPLKTREVARVGYIPIAVSKFASNVSLARKFIDFILSQEGRAVFKKHHYFMSPEEAFAWIGGKKPVGGEYAVPEEWVKK